MVLEMRGKWPNSCCFVEYRFQDLFNIARSIFFSLLVKLFSMCFVIVHVVLPCSYVDIIGACKKSSLPQILETI